MCDFLDDFEGLSENGFMDDEAFEDSLESEMGEPISEDSELDNEFDEAESQDDEYTAKDAFIAGSIFGFGYEQGQRERKGRKRKRFSED